MQQSAEKGYPVSRGYSWYVFSLLYLLYLFDYIDRFVVSSLFPYIKEEWGISDTEAGMLVSAVYWAIIIFSFPVSVVIDRWSRKKTIGIMSIFWGLATIASAFTANFRQLFMARSAIGLGEAGYAPGGTAIISAIFPEKKRAAVMGIWNSSIPLGSALGIAIGGIIAAKFGWRYAFGLVALPGLVVAILFFFIRDYRTVELPGGAGPQGGAAGWPGIVRDFTRKRSLVLTYLGFAGCTFVTSSLLNWLPSYYQRTEGLPMERASVKAGTIMLLAMLGAPLGGFLADRWMRSRRNARLVFCAITSLTSACVLYGAFMLLEGTGQYVLLLSLGVTITMFIPAAAAVTQDVVYPGLWAMSYSLCAIIQNLLGSSLGPIYVGFVSDRSDLLTALRTLPVFLAAAAVLFFAGSFFYVRDADSVQRVSIVSEE